MTRKAQIVGILALGLAATAARTPVIDRFVSSAHSLHEYMRDSNAADSSLSPVERLVFTLVLTKAKPPACDMTARPEHRT